MKLRLFFVVCAALTSMDALAQQALFSFGPNSSAVPETIMVSDFGMSRVHYTEEFALGNYRTYRPGRPIYGNLSFRMSLDTTPTMTMWINEILAGDVHRRGVAAILGSNTATAFHRHAYSDAWPTAIVLPECLHSAATVIQHGYVGMEWAGTIGPVTTLEHAPPAAHQKPWLSSNFRLKIGNLPCSRVSKIEAITIKQVAYRADLDGDGEGDYTASDLVFTLPTADVPEFIAWFSGPSTNVALGKLATLDYLNEDQTILRRFSFLCGIKSISVDQGTGGTQIKCSILGHMKWVPGNLARE